jgi:pimeloyl-ACP methyl ester carboxylesterase
MPTLTTTDGRTLAWHERGSGPPLLCHPGGPGSSSAYFGELAELAAECTLLLLDPRGTGESDRPADPSGYDLEDYEADIEALRRHLEIERLDLLAHSHGGFVAMPWAARHAEHVGKLILASTAPRFTDEIRQARRDRIASHHGQPYFDDAMGALRAHEEGRYQTDEELAELYRRESVLFAPIGVDPTPVFAALAAAGDNADALRHFNEHVAGGMDHRPLLTFVTAETLVISGELDPFLAGAHEIAEALPNGTLAIVPGADHFPFLEPESVSAWSRVVLDFLRA